MSDSTGAPEGIDAKMDRRPQGAEKNPPSSDVFQEFLDARVANYRPDGRDLAGTFRMKRLTVMEEHAVDVRRAALLEGLPWHSYSEDAQEFISALATLAVCIIESPEWYDRTGKAKTTSRVLAIGLYRKYVEWVLHTFREGRSDGQGKGELGRLEITSSLRASDGA